MTFTTRVSTLVLLCFLALGSAVNAQNQYAVLIPGAGSTSTRLAPFLIGGTSLTPLSAITVQASVFKVLPMPDGSKFYLIANQGSGGVATLDANFANLNPVAGNITLAPSDAALSPDGRRLVVLVSTGVFVIDTATDLVINTQGPISTGGTPQKITFSNDSSRAFVLSYGPVSSSIGTMVTAVDLTGAIPFALTPIFTTNQDVNSPATGLVVAPNGYIYLSNNYSFLEIDPSTMTGTAASPIGAHAYPGQPTITPDGKYLVAPNLRPNQGNTTMVQIDLATKKEVDLPQFTNGETLSQLIPLGADATGVNRLYAIGISGLLYDITLGTVLNANPSSVYNIFGVSNPTFLNIAFTNEVPPRYMIATSTTGQQLFQVDIKNSTISTLAGANTPTPLTIVSVSPQSGLTSIAGFNLTQTVNGGGKSPLPVVAKLVDGQGRGIFKGQITFTSTNLGVVITNPTAITGSTGFGQTFVNVPNVPGTYTVTATGGIGVSVDFTFTVPGIVPGGGTGGTGSNASAFNIVSGNGQAVSVFTGPPQPLVVSLVDVNNKPVVGGSITWTAVNTDGSVSLGGSNTTTTVTDANGLATITFVSSQPPTGNYASLTTITASTGTQTLSFYVTSIIIRDTASGVSQSLPSVDDGDSCTRANGGVACVPAGRTLTVTSGQLVKAAYSAYVYVPVGVSAGSAVGFIGLRAQNFQPTCVGGFCPIPDPNDPPPQTTQNLKLPYGTCVNNPLTDVNTGVAKCDLLIGPSLGTQKIYFVIGEYNYLAPLTIIVTPGPPAKITSTSGDKQAGNPNTKLPQLLGVLVADAGGNPSNKVPITWTVTPAGAATITPSSSSTDVNGRASVTVTLGAVSGPISIRAAVNGTTFVTFTETVNSLVSSVTAVSGENQTTLTNTAFGRPLVVLVKDSNGLPVAGNSVSFSATNGAKLSSPTVTTGLDGTASVTLTAGPTAGPISVTAFIAGFSASFTNLVANVPGPQITPASFLNFASNQQGLTPCGLAVIVGTNIAPGVSGTQQPSGFGPNPTSLGPVSSITIGGFPTPITFVSNINGQEQVGIQTPCEVPVGATNITMVVQGGSTTVTGVQVSQFQPGIFQTLGSDGNYYALALRPDGSFIGPSNPAVRGETIRLFATGLGQTTPRLTTNSAGTGGQSVNAILVGGVNDAGVVVTKAEYVAGQIGRYFVDITIPLDTATGPYQSLGLAVKPDVGDLIFGNGGYIPIR